MKSLDIKKISKNGSKEPAPEFIYSQENFPENFLEPSQPIEIEYELPFALPEPAVVQPRAKRFSFKPKYLLVPFTLAVLIFGAVIGSKFVSFANNVSTAQQSVYETVTQSIPVLNKVFDKSDVAAAISAGKTVNILLLGYGGSGHSGAELTDSIMVMSINFSDNKVTMISVPRDLWVKLPTSGYDGFYSKINSAYEYGLDEKQFPNKLPQFQGRAGGGNMSKFVISEVLGIPIDYYVSVDFDGFKEVVDALGGVQVNVENAFTDYSYPTSDQTADGAWCTGDTPDTACRYLKVHFDAGLQFMDGQTALEYARSRHAAGVEGSDFARSRRQQKLIAAIEQKALAEGLFSKVFDLMDAVSGHFQTDLSISDIKDLAGYVSKISFNDATKVGLTDNNLLVSGYSSDGQWIVTPALGQDDYTEIHKYIFDSINGIEYAPTAKTN